MNNYPKVTIITVCFNAAPLLRKTIENVIAQDYPNKEYIIIDGHSSDNTQELLQQYDKYIHTWISEPDKGIYDAMNKGVRLCTGQWAIFMNAGDTFASSNILTQVFSMPHHSDVIYGDVRKNNMVHKAEPGHNAHRMFFCHQCAFTRTTCLREYPFDLQHPFSADFKLYKTLIKAGKIFEQIHLTIADYDTSGISNTKRSAGIMDNIRIIREVDNLKNQLRLLPRLWFVYCMCRLRHK